MIYLVFILNKSTNFRKRGKKDEKLLKVFLVVMMLLAIVTPKALTAKEITSNENDYGTNYYLDSNINKKMVMG